MRKIAAHPTFDNVILVMIVITSIALAFESPLNDPKGSLEQWLKYLEYFSTAIFVGEVIIKIVATGFVINGSRSYLKDYWHIADFIIVVSSVLTLFPLALDLSFIKVVRMARLLRPLRVISKNENLKLSI
jgi:hypothetical protein